MRSLIIVFTLMYGLTGAVLASDFAKLDESLPSDIDILSIAPVFDFDGDSCLPSSGISRSGERNGGLKPSGSITGDCRSQNFLDTSNSLHRYACEDMNGSSYCAHMFALYFEKDQILDGIESGHRHDWEAVIVWTIDGEVTHGSYSAHGDFTTAASSEVEQENGHLKFVYHKDGVATHAMRFAKWGEQAENAYGEFVTPTIVDWRGMRGDGLPNGTMRGLIASFDYGSANLPLQDWRFASDINEFKPAEFPDFVSISGNLDYVQLVNSASGLCMDINGGTMANGTNVIQWHCSGAGWQSWYIDNDTRLIHSKLNPRFCLDNGGVFENGANIMIWECNGNNNQRVVSGGNNTLSMELAPNQVLDGYGMSAGDNVGTWWNWGGVKTNAGQSNHSLKKSMF